MDQSLFAAPHGLSQRITSFIACACQGIHQMPLRHLIVLIANAHHLAARFRRKRQQTGLPFTTQSIQKCHRRVRPDCFIGATPSSSLASGLKTSFSRLNPGPRGQATAIRSSIRRCNKAPNNRRSRATSFLPTSSSSTTSGRLGHPWFHKNWARTPGRTQHLEASRSIFSSRYMQNRHPTEVDANFVFLQKTLPSKPSGSTPSIWWS
jgi:hypothetical protein